MDGEPEIVQCPDFFSVERQMIILTDASLVGWEAVWNGVSTSGQKLKKEKTLLINMLKVLAITLAVLCVVFRSQSNIYDGAFLLK